MTRVWWRRGRAALVAGIVAITNGCAHVEQAPTAPESPPSAPDLAPAPRDLTAARDLAAPVDLAPMVDLSPPADLTPPRQWTLRLHVTRVEINRGVFHLQDAAAVMTAGLSSLWKKPRACPDVSWTLFVGTDVAASGVERRCRYSASWPKEATAAKIVDGRSIRLRVYDRGSDTLGSFEWKSAEELASAIAAGKSLRNDHVMGLRLDGSELREVK